MKSEIQDSRTVFRGVRAAAVMAFGLLASPFALAAAPAATVAAIQPTRVADLILLDRGFDAGLRQGMVCRVTRGTTEIAEVLLVELRPTCSAALILNLSAKQFIRVGDVARVKVLKT
jgi:hypothetical protein